MESTNSYGNHIFQANHRAILSAKSFTLLPDARSSLRDAISMLKHWNSETFLEVSGNWEEFYKPVASLKK